MRIFISSLITGFEAQRTAARRAVTTLRHEPVMAEDFGAQLNSPQIACLQGLRASDAVVLVLGEHYGFVPPNSTLSATHQEYREARETKPVFAFIQEGISPSPEQAALIAEVQAWEGGLFRGSFVNADDLQDGVTRALHDVTLANATGPVDEQEMTARASAMLPAESQNQATPAMLELVMRRYRRAITETAGFYNTVGFNDDTRAFLSIPARHDLARRIDCGFLAELVAQHSLEDWEAADLAQDLAYNLAKKAYRL
ncbi:DUF4062 domain-containing protein [Altererythrobacter indicus]|uniref:Uronate isomerase n=1 Tax=Altericroceibacterium indicum TaxID=374177 RepID=A0A845ACR4_9SPHN|nr:DUF4062 domain-containing protein [Altericroceibacterium indicum]